MPVNNFINLSVLQYYAGFTIQTYTCLSVYTYVCMCV